MSAAPSDRSSRTAPLVWVADTLVGAAAVGAALYLALLAAPFRGSPLLTWSLLAMIAALGCGVVVVFAIVVLARRRRAPAWRVAAYLMALGLVLFGLDRRASWQLANRNWPPNPHLSFADNPSTLEPGDRARWATAVMAHALAAADSDTLVAVPPSWPYPAGVELAIDSTPTATLLLARTPEDTVACLALAHGTEPIDAKAACAEAGRPAYSTPARSVMIDDASISDREARGSDDGWPQYRSDVARRAIVDGESADTSPWRATTEGPIRASVSVVDGRVLVGGHGIGALTVLAAHNGELLWRTHLPNWIHQDPLSDGVLVLATFGDNAASFDGRSPSGIAAYDLADGQHRWTMFDETSVMTSGVLHGSEVIYATSGGVLRWRDLATGALHGELELPGGVIMAPLAAAGDTLVATLDRNHVCAVDARARTPHWCRTLAHLRMLGHSAPAVADGTVFLSGRATLLSLTLADFFRLDATSQRRLLRTAFTPVGDDETIAGMVIVALDLATGHTRWVSPVFGFRQEVEGHTSGTPVLTDSIGVVVLPNADTLVAFDVATGAVRWSHGAHLARGPVLVAAEHVILAGRDGVIEVRRLTDGVLRCSLTRETGWDRAGPTLAGSLVIFADLKGVVEALPIEDLLQCREAGMRADSQPATTAGARAPEGTPR